MACIGRRSVGALDALLLSDSYARIDERAPALADKFRVGGENLERSRSLADQLRNYVSNYTENGRRGVETVENERALIASEVARGVPLEDVVEDVRSVGRLMYFARQAKVPVPAVSVEEVGRIPVIDRDFAYSAFYEGLWRSRREFERWWERRSVRSVGGGLQFISPEQGLEGFHSGLSLFLGYRFEGFSFWRRQPRTGAAISSGPPSPGTAAPGATGFYIQLSCVHYHLAAYASPAYALTWRNFGSFTTPANGILPPGAWIFGAQGGLYPHITPDPTPVHIPPTFTPSTTCF